jgi:alpha-L-rhamnosidase
VLQPHPTSKLSYARASFESPYGKVESGWERKEGKVIVKVSIPANTQATVFLPVDDITKVKENGTAVSSGQEIKDVMRIGLTRGSGEYIFEYNE